MVDRAHFKDSLPAGFKRHHLQHDRQHFNYENPADDEEQQFALGNDRDSRNRPADAERPRVTHEYLGRMRVKHEKAEHCADHGRRANRSRK
ncbi:hypothetical protein D3C81_2124770 [compost metagenome]